MIPKLFKRTLLPIAILVALLIPTVGQRPLDDFGNFRQRRRPLQLPNNRPVSFGEFTFVRTIYDSPARGYGRGYATAAAPGPPIIPKPTTTSSSVCANGPAPI